MLSFLLTILVLGGANEYRNLSGTLRKGAALKTLKKGTLMCIPFYQFLLQYFGWVSPSRAQRYIACVRITQVLLKRQVPGSHPMLFYAAGLEWG